MRMCLPFVHDSAKQHADENKGRVDLAHEPLHGSIFPFRHRHGLAGPSQLWLPNLEAVQLLLVNVQCLCRSEGGSKGSGLGAVQAERCWPLIAL